MKFNKFLTDRLHTVDCLESNQSEYEGELEDKDLICVIGGMDSVLTPDEPEFVTINNNHQGVDDTIFVTINNNHQGINHFSLI